MQSKKLAPPPDIVYVEIEFIILIVIIEIDLLDFMRELVSALSEMALI